MKSWPTLQEYNQALLQSGMEALRISGLKPARIQTNAFGLPNALSGGFAYIYQLILKDGSRRALRLFHTLKEGRTASLRESYRLVQHHRQNTKEISAFLVEANWIDDCLQCASGLVPGVLMDWVEAPVLASWLEKQYAQPESLRSVREELAKLQQALESSGLIHGDLQANNIAVTSDNRLVLLDYDNVSSIDECLEGWEAGHIHFQHPDPERSPRGIDRFPLLVMDLGLALLEEAPDLFGQYGEGENILFTADDFALPRSSTLIDRASRIPGMARACELFIALCEGPAAAVPTIAEFREAAELDGVSGQRSAAATPADTHRSAAKGGVITSNRETHTYRPVYPVYSPQFFLDSPSKAWKSKAANLVGQKIELVGLVAAIKKGRTKYDDPYVFVNFNDWRLGGIKLIFWSEGLDAFEDRPPDTSWEGRWITATGMVDEPYYNLNSSILSYSITITDPSQVRFIGKTEASRRLASAKPIPAPADPSTPAAPAAPAAAQPIRTPAVPARETKNPSNAELLRQLKGQLRPPVQSQNTPPPPVKNKQSDSSGCATFIIVTLMILLWIIMKRFF